ncbi:MAG: hypothetical protein M3311_07450 [Thermoproteota archaeon]|nr:hypothetical protein [Thermoproteota archaeon]
MGLKKREQKEYNDIDNVDNDNYNNNHTDEQQQKEDEPRAIKMAEELQKKNENQNR